MAIYGNNGLIVEEDDIDISRQLLRKAQRKGASKEDIAAVVCNTINQNDLIRQETYSYLSREMDRVNVTNRMVTAFVLRTQMDWGQKRIEQFMEWMDEVTLDLNECRITADDIAKTLVDECGVAIELKGYKRDDS